MSIIRKSLTVGMTVSQQPRHQTCMCFQLGLHGSISMYQLSGFQEGFSIATGVLLKHQHTRGSCTRFTRGCAMSKFAPRATANNAPSLRASLLILQREPARNQGTKT
jgi:hypothetical protein